jgi:hypothetical protein
MWWEDLLWGFWNGLTAWIVLIAHVFDWWERYPFYNEGRSGNWYDFGFLLGAGLRSWALAVRAGAASSLLAPCCCQHGAGSCPIGRRLLSRARGRLRA